MKTPILAIVHTLSAWHKTNGYSTHRTVVTNCATGNRVVIVPAGGRGNVGAIVNAILRCKTGEYANAYNVEENADCRTVDRSPAKEEIGKTHFYENNDGRRALANLFNVHMCEVCNGSGRVSTGKPAQNYDNGQKRCEACASVGYVKGKK